MKSKRTPRNLKQAFENGYQVKRITTHPDLPSKYCITVFNRRLKPVEHAYYWISRIYWHSHYPVLANRKRYYQ